MGKKTVAFPKTKGSKTVGYVKKFGMSSKENDPAKCRQARLLAKKEAILEHKRRKEMGVVDQEREIAARAAAESLQKIRAKERSRRMRRLMTARRKKDKMDRRLLLRKLRRDRIAKLNLETDTLWEKNGAQYIEWYLRSFELNPKPVHFMTVPNLLEPLNCECNKKCQLVDVYMTHWHKQVAIQHCDCRSLVEALLLMQMMPSSFCTPRTALHFGLLDYLHLLKMGSQVSNHAFTNITNKSIEMSQIPSKPFRLLNKNTLNRSYFLYRRLTAHANDFLDATYNLKHSNCLCCNNPTGRIVVNLDGNFQLKRRANTPATAAPAPASTSAHTPSFPPPIPTSSAVAIVTHSRALNLLGPSKIESSLWGSREEVDKFENPDKADVDNCMIEELEREFKAVSNRNRTMYNRYDENGLFSMTCSRHGIPLRMYDIYRGEGRKYALASVEHLLKTRDSQQPLSIMYDIACLCKSRLESTFPILKDEDTLYAIPIFHAYAHNIHCQLQYNPRYIAGFGLTDGEGTERFWSYLNGFASMTRSMTSTNRHLVLTDAVEHYNDNKMVEIPRLISKKFQSCNTQLLSLAMSEETFAELQQSWEKKVELLAYPGKKVSGVHDAVARHLIEHDDPLFLYLDLVSQLIALGLCHTRVNKEKKEVLLKKIEELEASQQFDFPRPTSINHPFLRRYASIVDQSVAVALKNYFTELIKCCCLYENKRDACRGSAKAQKISLALDSFKKSAREAQAILQSHVDDKFANDDAAKAMYATNTIDREIAFQKVDVDGYFKNTTEMVKFHLYNRTLEEVEMLVNDADQYLRNIDNQVEDLKRAIASCHVAGHFAVLANRYEYLAKLQDKAKDMLKDVVSPDTQSTTMDVGEAMEHLSLTTTTTTSHFEAVNVDVDVSDGEEDENEDDEDDDDEESETEDEDPNGLNDYNHSLEG